MKFLGKLSAFILSVCLIGSSSFALAGNGPRKECVKTSTTGTTVGTVGGAVSGGIGAAALLCGLGVALAPWTFGASAAAACTTGVGVTAITGGVAAGALAGNMVGESYDTECYELEE